MSRFSPKRENNIAVLAVVDQWVSRCLKGGGSLFSEAGLWNENNIQSLVKLFIEKPDEGEGTFLVKLKGQLASASVEVKQLASEMLYVMLLFPSNISQAKKRDIVLEVWGWSGASIDTENPLLSDGVLWGVGSGGMGYNTNRWREFSYFIHFMRAYLALPLSKRETLLSDGWSMDEWLEALPENDSRQFRHMLLFLLFPDQFERISGGVDRVTIVSVFTGEDRKLVQSKYSAFQLDRRLYEIREEQELQYGTKDLDFYEPPLRDVWKTEPVNHWLFCWNPSKWEWSNLANDIAATKKGEKVTESWSCSNGNVKEGDRAWLVRLGIEPKGIMASGIVVSEPYEAPHYDPVKAAEGKTRKAVDIEFDRIVDVFNDPYITEKDLAKVNADKQEWFPVASGIEIKKKSAATLEGMWKPPPFISKEDFIKAFNMPNVLRDRDMEMLGIWRAMPDCSATSRQLAEAMGYDNFIVTNGMLGRLSRRVNDALHLGFKSDDDANKYWLELLSDFNHQPDSDLILVMKKELVMAFDEMVGKPQKPPVISMAADSTNLILYGPPGTGKTFELGKLAEQYVSAANLQSREQWLMDQLRDLRWFDAIFMSIYQMGGTAKVSDIASHEYLKAKAAVSLSKNIKATIWGSLQNHTVQDSSTVNFTNRGNFPAVFDKDDDSSWRLVGDWQSDCADFILKAEQLKSGKAITDAVRRYDFVTFHQAYSYEDFVEGIRPVQDEESGELVYRVIPGVFRRICQKAKDDPANRYAIFIDEINRGNIARIFGELITLIETDKRARYNETGDLVEGMALTLPYSCESFGVPANLDIYGSMNTADRSIALLDTALRRRFNFRELMPDSSIITGSRGDGYIEDGQGGVINLRALLDAMNRRIRFLLNRDLMLGHAYLCKVRDFTGLRDVLLNQLVPLLQEYFYNDWHRIQLVFRDIGENDKRIEPQIIVHEKLSEEAVLGFDHDDFEDLIEYRVARPEDITPEAIRKIYA